MTVVPITFEDIQEYLLEEEKVICKSIKLDEGMRRLIKKNGIKIKEEEIENILNSVNRMTKRKYRTSIFLKQTRFQAIKQIIDCERGMKEEQSSKLNDISRLVELIGDNIEEIEDEEGIPEVIKLIEELPDSNFLKTNDVEIIEMFDDVREKLMKNANKIRKLSKDIQRLGNVNGKIENDIVNNDKDIAIDIRISEELERLRYLIAIKD